jgi:hypothetical protein
MTKFLPFYYDDENGFLTNQKCFFITSPNGDLTYLTAVFNSSLFRCCFRDNFPELLGNTYELSKIFVDKLPLKKPTALQAVQFDKLVHLVQLAKRTGEDVQAEFLEDLIDACVMECYFKKHMAERDLIFLDDVAPHLAAYDPDSGETKKRRLLGHLITTLNAPSAKIRNRLLRLSADSPDLLAVIKKEGKV